MIILSVGMPRAGSGWYYNLTNDLMLANGAQDARLIRQRYHLQSILTEVNCNIGVLSARRVLAILPPALMGNTFVVKAHAAPSAFALWVIRRGWIRPTYIYRDPRDAMLSAMENGKRAIARGHPNAFAPYVEFEPALSFILEYLKIWDAWLKVDQALAVRYEDLLVDYDLESKRLTRFLGLDPKQGDTCRVIESYRPARAQADQKGLHFSHGKIGRFRQKMNPEQQAILSERLGPYLDRMGYEI